jgi:hypothetical protein
MFETECHCGNIKITATEKPETLTNCNCSICYRYGVLWAYFTDKETEIKIKNNESSYYSCNTMKVKFHHCTNCSCITHYTSIRDNGESRVAINAKMAPKEHISSLPIRDFDGADTWKYLN